MPSAHSPSENAADASLDQTQLLRVLAAVKKGDFSARMPEEKPGVAGKIAEALNELIELNRRASQEDETDRLLAREAMQRDFVATVSHELRTPIAAIKGFAETLRLGGLDDPKNRLHFIRIIEKHADRLGWLVEDILTRNAIESGKLKPQPETLHLGRFAERLVANLLPLAARRGVDVGVSVPAQAAVIADPRHLGRILQNLLDNAIKYNVRGGKVSVTAGREGALFCVSVSDTGIGIPKHDLPLIFQQFHRSETAKAAAVGGNGLGLYIIKSLVESNGGKIWAESVQGRGSTFHFTVPAAQTVGRQAAIK